MFLPHSVPHSTPSSPDSTPAAALVIMSESTIRQQVGGPSVLAGQLRHLLGLIEELPDTLDVRVVPYTSTGHHAMGGSAFHLMTFPSGTLPTLVWQETVTSTQLIQEPQTVREYGLAYAEIYNAALSKPDSIDLIKKVAMEQS
ncbi:MAG: DUF5753 domain-containing protein [Pseudonocardiales bacterium]